MNKVAVIKFDGNVFNEKDMIILVNNVKYLRKLKYKVIICHGTDNIDNESSFINGKDNDFQSILFKISINITTFLNKNGISSISINGTDSFFVKCKSNDKVFSEIYDIDCDLIDTLIDKDYVPVISSIGSDDLGKIYNLNSNVLSSNLSIKIGADLFIVMSDYDLYIDGKKIINKLDKDSYKDLIKNDMIDYNLKSIINSLMDYSKHTLNVAYLIHSNQELSYDVFHSKIGIKVNYSGLDIRIALREDIPNILKLMRDAFPKYQSYIDYKIYPLIEDEYDLYADMLNNLFFVCYKNNKLLGHIRFKIEGENSRIYRVCVDPKHQKQGIGSSLLSYVESYAKMKGMNSIGLTTIGGVDYLNKFYSKNGYKLYSNNDSRGYNRVLMIKNLKNNDIIDTNWFYLK